MSFLETRSAIAIVNRALSKIGQNVLTGAIDDPINQGKLAGREAKLHYKSTVRSLLAAHFWGFGRTRAPLGAIVNDRGDEWAAAYRAPPDMAFPISVNPPTSTTGTPVSYYRGIGYLLGRLYGRPVFRYEGSTIYSSYSDAVLEYATYNVTEEDFSQEFEDQLVDQLAAKFAYSIAKEEAMGARLEKAALQKLNVIIAQNLNLTQPRYDMGYVSEGELAREGALPLSIGAFPYR